MPHLHKLGTAVALAALSSGFANASDPIVEVISPIAHDSDFVFDLTSRDEYGEPTQYSGSIAYASNTPIWLSAQLFEDFFSSNIAECQWTVLGETYVGNNVLLPGLPIGITDVTVDCPDAGRERNITIPVKVVPATDSVVVPGPTSVGPSVVSAAYWDLEAMTEFTFEGRHFSAYQARQETQWMVSGIGLSMLTKSDHYSIIPDELELLNGWLTHIFDHNLDTIMSEVHDSVDGTTKIIMQQYRRAGQYYVAEYDFPKWIGVLPGQTAELDPATDFENAYNNLKKETSKMLTTNHQSAIGIQEHTSEEVVGLGKTSLPAAASLSRTDYDAKVSMLTHERSAGLIGQYALVTLNPDYPFFDTYRIGSGITGPETYGVTNNESQYALHAVNTSQNYDLMVKYPAAKSWHSKSVKYTLDTATGPKSFTVDQTTASPGFVTLGTVRLPSTATLMVSDATGANKSVSYTEIKVAKSADQSTGSRLFSAGKSILVDFGSSSYVAKTGHWNSMTAAATLGTPIPNAKMADGNPSEIAISITNKFNGVNTGGKTTNTLGYDPLATRDSFYTRAGDPAEITVSNLHSVGVYTARIYASRIGTDGTYGNMTQYRSGGQAVTLDAADNTSRIAELTGLVPDANGKIAIQVDVASTARYGYLGMLELVRTQ